MMVTNNNRRYVLLLFTGLLFIMATVSPLVALAEEKPTEKDFAKFRQTDTAEIEAKFAALAQKTPDAAHIVAVQAAAEDIETIAAKAMEAMDGVRARVVSDLMSNALGTGAEAKKPRVIPITHADEVRNLYTKHYAVIRKAVAATEGKSAEALLARQYLDATLAAAQNYILNAYLGSKDFLKGLAVIKAIIILADAENKIDEAVKTRFRLAEVYVMYGHTQLAAEEMKSVITNYPGHKEYGKAVLMRIQLLNESRLYDRILEEIPDILADKAAADYMPQIIYIAWRTNCRQAKQEAADDLQARFMRDYPGHPLCAEMHYAAAMHLLAIGEYANAVQLLEMISEKYPKTSVAAQSRNTLSRIKETQQRVSESASIKPGGV